MEVLEDEGITNATINEIHLAKRIVKLQENQLKSKTPGKVRCNFYVDLGYTN